MDDDEDFDEVPDEPLDDAEPDRVSNFTEIQCYTGRPSMHVIPSLHFTIGIFQDNDGNIEVLDEAEREPQQVPPEKRMCTPYMTKYERARVLGTRALQIA